MWDDWFENEHPAHEVKISQGFWLGRCEITQAQWESVMGARPWSGQLYVPESPDHPAAYISWYDVQAFIRRVNEAAGEGLYRLPTEAEWEFAARAGTSALWPFGDDERRLGDYAWYWDNTCDVGECYAHAVGTRLPNPLGLYDMYGNVWEWCQDWFSSGYYSTAPRVDPPGPASGSERVARGGVFDDEIQYVRPANRGRAWPGFPLYYIGARLVRVQ
jgi:formylglycine-generating enzyme required for sulfatase activity